MAKISMKPGTMLNPGACGNGYLRRRGIIEYHYDCMDRYY